jgi:hypothetical protein
LQNCFAAAKVDIFSETTKFSSSEYKKKRIFFVESSENKSAAQIFGRKSYLR